MTKDKQIKLHQEEIRAINQKLDEVLEEAQNLRKAKRKHDLELDKLTRGF